MDDIIIEVKGFFKVIKLKSIRKTEGVKFDVLALSIIK